MRVTLEQLIRNYPAWRIQDLAQGWVAMRRTLVPRASGLSNVRCGETSTELAANLEAETRLK
ncbi:hypothetical protein [Nonomuraea solani]|uniref:hypothetical protein n=1 Tax=Nonomuraea solani TaxID=1144553 RepID=UPI000CDE835E|nr:hypothetical protein [Nonomuraea solani]